VGAAAAASSARVDFDRKVRRSVDIRPPEICARVEGSRRGERRANTGDSLQIKKGERKTQRSRRRAEMVHGYDDSIEMRGR